MGTSDSKVDFRTSINQLRTRTQQLESYDDGFWEQFWSEKITSVQDVFALIPTADIRSLREEYPSNMATLCNKLVDRLQSAAEHSCQTRRDQTAAINCIRLLTRLLPYIFEESEWRGFFWSDVPTGQSTNKPPLAERLMQTLADLLFCPDFTVASKKKRGPDQPEDIHTIDSCEYIWEIGVGFTQSPVHVPIHERNRTEILRLLLTCFSETIYTKPSAESQQQTNKWVTYFTSIQNRQTLPLFTSLINVIFSYDPVGYLPYNYLLFTDTREALVEVAAQILCVTLESHSPVNFDSFLSSATNRIPSDEHPNLFVNYLSRIHRDEDFNVLLKGFCRLLNNPLVQTYLPGSCKKISFYQELLILFWKLADRNKKFLYFVLKSSEVLDIVVPILYFLNDARSDTSRIGLMHIGIFILLLLSGERNFGVRLNKPYVTRVPMDISVFTGTHADLLIIVFHKIMVSANQRLQPLYDCLLTIIVNISPYLKSLSMVTSNKIVHLLEAFSSPWFLFAAPDHHHLVFFLLEACNNLIQYQFDGNANLIYSIIRKRQIFYSLNNLAIDGPIPSTKTSSADTTAAVPTTVTTTLADTPSIHKMTEKTVAASPHLDDEPRRRITSHNEISEHSSTTKIDPDQWTATPEWVQSWKGKLPLQTIHRLLQVLVPQVEQICVERGLTDESEILKFLQHGTLVGLLPVPHPILIRKYQPNSGTILWFRTYMWGVIYLRNIDPPIWFDTDVKLFELQHV